MHQNIPSTNDAPSAPTTTAEALRALARAVDPHAHLTLEAGRTAAPQLVFHAPGVDLILPLTGPAPARPTSVALAPDVLPRALAGLQGRCEVGIARGRLTLRDAGSEVTLIGRHTHPQRARPTAGGRWRVHPPALRTLARLTRGDPDEHDCESTIAHADGRHPLMLALHTAHGPVLAELAVLRSAAEAADSPPPRVATEAGR